jgi:LAO/AO transport system kinase
MKARSVNGETAASLAARLKGGDRAAAARAISWIEDHDPRADEVLKRICAGAVRSHVVGVTGPPGVGKSTLIAALVDVARRQGVRVAALLVDPSSPFSGGAVLGDRLRLEAHAGDPAVFVRSLASRGAVGGLASAIWGARRVVETLGAELIFVESVGAGQADVEISRCADTVIVALMPGLGDDVQAIKAGILEIADALVVNKADLPDKDRTLASLRAFWADDAEAGGAGGGWKKLLLQTVASRGEGVPAVWSAIQRHRDYLGRSGEGATRRLRQARAEILAHLEARSRREWISLVGKEAERLAAGRTDPVSAADRLLARPARRKAARRRA